MINRDAAIMVGTVVAVIIMANLVMHLVLETAPMEKYRLPDGRVVNCGGCISIEGGLKDLYSCEDGKSYLAQKVDIVK